MLNTILVDAGPLIALFDKDDKYGRQQLLTHNSLNLFKKKSIDSLPPLR